MITSLKPQPTPVRTETVAFWRAQPGALLLLGRASGPMPKGGSARLLSAPGGVGVFRIEFWQTAEPNAYAFLAVIRLPDRADPVETAELALHGARAADRDIAVRLGNSLSEVEFGRQLASLGGGHAAQLARFILDITRPQTGSDLRRPHALVTAFLSRAARPEGCIELILSVPDRCLLLQGWGTSASDDVEVLLTSSGLPRFDAPVAKFVRPDVLPPATGCVLSLPAEAASPLAGLDTVYILSGDELVARQIIEPKILDADSSAGQIRHLLPRLTCSPDLMEFLRSAIQPPFEGVETLSSCGRPVRAALDVMACAPGAGVFLSGWLHDPAGHVAEVGLGWSGGCVRLDEDWVRISRDDVCAAFRSDPSFPAAFGAEPGFAVACREVPVPAAAPHLRLKFTDGEIAFLPVRLQTVSTSTAQKALLDSIDLHKPSCLAIVERHAAPFIARLQRHEAAFRMVLRGPLERPNAVVVPLPHTVLPRSFMSSFLADAAQPDEQIVFVCGPGWSYDDHQRLIDLIECYQLPASVVALTDAPQPAAAAQVAARATLADNFLLVSSGVAGAAPGWRRTLFARASEDEVVCPTLLYEDRSIRFAGEATLVFSHRAPFSRRLIPAAGFTPETLSSTSRPQPMTGGSLACCLLRRDVLPSLERATTFCTDFGQEMAFFLDLGAMGHAGTWLSSVSVTVPEEPGESHKLPRLVDGWMLKDLWGGPAQCAF